VCWRTVGTGISGQIISPHSRVYVVDGFKPVMVKAQSVPHVSWLIAGYKTGERGMCRQVDSVSRHSYVVGRCTS
jgi:hypothetical protein